MELGRSCAGKGIDKIVSVNLVACRLRDSYNKDQKEKGEQKR